MYILIYVYISFKILGKVLKANKGLTELDIEANSLTPKAATVLANSISFNDTLLKLNINGNVLGKTGAQALVVKSVVVSQSTLLDLILI